MTFEDWSADVQLLSGWLKARSPHVPLLLHGLELGAVLAGREFHAGVGDGLLLWSAPANANQALRSTLMRWVSLEQIFKRPDERKTVSDYIRDLERGSSLEVDGYLWSTRLWRESFDLPCLLGWQAKRVPLRSIERPVRIVKLVKRCRPWQTEGLRRTTNSKTSTGCLLQISSGSSEHFELQNKKSLLCFEAIETP